MTDNKLTIAALISTIKETISPGSVTNDMVSRVLSYLYDRSESCESEFVTGVEIEVSGSDLRMVVHRAGDDEIFSIPCASDEAAGALSAEMYRYINEFRERRMPELNRRLVDIDNNITAAKTALFDDILRDLGVTVVKAGEEYSLNGVTGITLEEMRKIYAAGQLRFPHPQAMPQGIRTNLPPVKTMRSFDTLSDITDIFRQNTTIEVANLDSRNDGYPVRIESAMGAFSYCSKLKKIIGIVDVSQCKDWRVEFGNNFSAIEHFSIKGLSKDLYIAEWGSIDLASLQYMVANAANGSKAITITVHADVFAKLDDATNTQWHKVMTDAVAKNISFATV